MKLRQQYGNITKKLLQHYSIIIIIIIIIIMYLLKVQDTSMVFI